MKLIHYILFLLLLTSCLTERRFNKILDKGLEKGWVKEDSVKIDTTFKNNIDTNKIKEKIKSVIDTVFKDTTIYKDTCYNKQGKIIGRKIDEKKLKEKLEKVIKDTLVIPSRMRCIENPLFFDKDGVVVEVSQDLVGNFNVKTKLKNITINKPEGKSWLEKQKDVWYLYLLIVLLTVIIIIKR